MKRGVDFLAGHKNFQVHRNKAHKGINTHRKQINFNKSKEVLTKSERFMNGVAFWAGFYRYNPHRFVRDYLGINLKTFQKILIYMMNYCYYFMYLASRGWC